MKLNLMVFIIGMTTTPIAQVKRSIKYLKKRKKHMMRQLIFSYKVTKGPMKLVTSLVGNNFFQLKGPSYRGRHIWCNFNQIIVNYQRVTKLLKLLIYKYFFVTLLQKLFQPRDRERKIMVDGRQDYTSPVSCREIPDSGDRAKEH